MESVEILVSDHARAKVVRALGALPGMRFTTDASRRSGHRLFITLLEDLETEAGRRELGRLYRVAVKGMRDVPMVYIGKTFAEPMSHLALQAFARWSHIVEREPFIASEPEAVRRMVLAHGKGAEKELIASVAIEDEKLVVWSCEPRRFEVPVAEMPALARMSGRVRANFELSASGSRIRWPEADVDINLDTIREHADPEVRREHEARARQDATRYADAIRRLREERGLKQSDVEGLTDRQVRRLEEGGTVPQIETLKKLAAAHGMTIEDYLGELAKRSRKAPRRVPRLRRR